MQVITILVCDIFIYNKLSLKSVNETLSIEFKIIVNFP